MRCATHPNVETFLCCGKCGKPICPKCLVQTPVGARCRDCANVRPLPTYQVSVVHYLKALGVGLGLALAIGMIWALLRAAFFGCYISFLIAPVSGYGIGELISLSVNHKRGWGLAVIGGVCVVIGYFISYFGFIFWGLWEFLFVAGGIFIAVNRLR